MQITFTGTQQDFIHAQRAHAWRKKSAASAKAWLRYGPWLGAFFVGLGMLFLWDWHLSPLLAFIEFICGFYLILGSTVISPWRWRRAYQRRHSGPPRETILTFEPEAIQCECPGHSKGTLEWRAIEGVVEGEETMLLYLSPATFLHIPSRVITQEQKGSLIAMLKEKGVPFTYPTPRKD